jgi:hypothetical protein
MRDGVADLCFLQHMAGAAGNPYGSLPTSRGKGTKDGGTTEARATAGAASN